MWIGIAYARNVRELSLNCGAERTMMFEYPRGLYNCETLETLKLSAQVRIDVPACLKSLRTLHLHYVEFTEDRYVINLLSGCPNLENLEVHRRRDDDDEVKIFTVAVPSLQRLTIHDEDASGGYVIDAPSLKYLTIQGVEYRQCCMIENAPELVEAKIVNVSKIFEENILISLISVKILSLTLSPLEITFPTDSIFYQLVHLELHTHKAEWWKLLLLMLDTSPRLQVLKLIDQSCSDKYRGRSKPYRKWSDWSQPKNVPECLLSHLETFVWRGYKQRPEEEKEVAKYILRNTNRLKRATFSQLPFQESNSQEMVDELESVVRASSSCELVFE